MQAWTVFALSLLSIFLKDFGVTSLKVTVPDEIFAINGGTAVFEISYSLSSGESFHSVTLLNDINIVFSAPAIVYGQYFPNGRFSGLYESRCSTDYSAGKTRFSITISHVAPGDEGNYVVEITRDQNLYGDRVDIQLVIDFLPRSPYISGAPTSPVLGGAGPTVLTCTANLGKPQASMVWSRRIGSGAYTNITKNVNITTTNNNDGTTNGNSILTVNLDTADDGVQFRCQLSNRQATLSAETGAIKVTAPVPVTDDNIQVCQTFITQCTSPFDYYINDQVSLTCGVTSSPPIPTPHEYKWYQQDIGGRVISGPDLSFKITESETVYVCSASNTVRGVTNTVSKQVTIRGAAKPTRSLPEDTMPSKDTSTKAKISDKSTDGMQPVFLQLFRLKP